MIPEMFRRRSGPTRSSGGQSDRNDDVSSFEEGRGAGDGSADAQTNKEHLGGRPRRKGRVLLSWLCAGVLLSGSFFFLSVARLSPLTTTSIATTSSRIATTRSSHVFMEEQDQASGTTTEESECTVWVAPSSLKGVNGYGVFTTRDIQKGESILGAPDGLGVVVEDIRYDEEPKKNERRHWKSLFDNYWWGRGLPDHVVYEASYDSMDFQYGFGTLPNHNCVLDYLHTKYPNPPYIDSMANRFHEPGAGAFSYNRGREFTLSHSLEAGSEIFLNYGWCSPSETAPGWTEHAYGTEDFKQAAAIISRYESLNKKGRGGVMFDPEGNLLLPAGTKLVQELIPKSKHELDSLLAAAKAAAGTSGSDHKEELIRQVALNSLNRRTPEWIKANGMCMDNLIARRSTLPFAGQGGFAQRTIRKGEMVAPAPLMQVIDKDALILYDKKKKPTRKQLLLNYCFGHPETAMLLCPNTNAVLINHCSVRTKGCGPKGPNAYVRWASGWDPASDMWRKMSLKQISEQTTRGLSFEIIALRDISPGEEVFIDYGEEWERAWDRHIATWVPPLPPAQKRWITAEEANADNDAPILEDLISGNPRKRADHPYLFTGCQYWQTDMDKHKNFKESYDWRALSDRKILYYYSDPGTQYAIETSKNKDHRMYSYHRDHSYWPCTVIRRDDTDNDDVDVDGYHYTVRIHAAPWAENGHNRPPWAENNVPRILTNYSRTQIHYFVKPYESDQHLPGVFRQPIGIPDDLLPSQWRNNVPNIRSSQ